MEQNVGEKDEWEMMARENHLRAGDEFMWIVDYVLELPDELQRPKYILSLGARRLDQLLTEHPQHDAVDVAVALIRLIDIALIDSFGQVEAYSNELITHLISTVEHLAAVDPDSLLPLLDHVRSDSFSLLFTTKERDHEACEAVLRILGECLEATEPAPSEVYGENLPSTYFFSVVERHLDRSRDHRLSMALPMWEWSLNFGDGVTPRNNVKDLLQWAGERADGDHSAALNRMMRTLSEAVEQPHTQYVNLGFLVVEKEEFLDGLRELWKCDAFFELLKQHSMFSVHALVQLLSLCQEYNVEWALASFDWSAAVEEDVEHWREERVARAPLVG